MLTVCGVKMLNVCYNKSEKMNIDIVKHIKIYDILIIWYIIKYMIYIWIYDIFKIYDISYIKIYDIALDAWPCPLYCPQWWWSPSQLLQKLKPSRRPESWETCPERHQQYRRSDTHLHTLKITVKTFRNTMKKSTTWWEKLYTHTTVQNLGLKFKSSKKFILLFSKDALNWSKMTFATKGFCF